MGRKAYQYCRIIHCSYLLSVKVFCSTYRFWSIRYPWYSMYHARWAQTRKLVRRQTDRAHDSCYEKKGEGRHDWSGFFCHHVITNMPTWNLQCFVWPFFVFIYPRVYRYIPAWYLMKEHRTTAVDESLTNEACFYFCFVLFGFIVLSVFLGCSRIIQTTCMYRY